MTLRALSVFCVLLVVVGTVGVVPATVHGGAGSGDTAPTSAPAPAVAPGSAADRSPGPFDDAAGKQRVIVRLAEPPATATQAATAAERKDRMQSHAATTQTTFERFAAGNPHVEIERSLWVANALVVTVDTDRIPIERLGFVENVERVHEDFEIERTQTASVAAGSILTDGQPSLTATRGSATWGLETIRAPETWAAFDKRGEGVRIAVLDTGVDPTHPDIDVAGWKDFTSDPASSPLDYGDHGTHVSGTVVGGNTSGTAIGVAPEAELYHGAVLSEDGSGTFSQVIAGIEWAVENDADVVSMSLGASGYRSELIEPLRNARDAGTIPVSSSGNSGSGSSSSPGNIYDAVSVGATTSDDDVASFSSGEMIDTADAWGSDAPSDWPTAYPVPDISAPGHSINSAVPGGYETKSGTSMAAPHISGAIALILSNGDAELSPTAIEQLLVVESADIGETEVRQGAGRLDVYNATLAHSRATLEPTITPQQANVSVPTTLSVVANHPLEAYHWSFEDGTTVRTTEPTIERSFESLSTTETLSVTLEDERGNITTVSHEIAVVDEFPPVAALTVNQSAGIEVGIDDVNFDASNSTDNDEIDRYEWAFGDGTTETTTEPTTTHRYNTTGTVSATVNVVDASENTNTTSYSFEVVDTTPPTAGLVAPTTPYAGVQTTLDGGTSSDNHEIATYNWSVGDTAISTTDPMLNYTFDDSGEYTVELTVADPAGNTNATTTTFTVRGPPTVSVTAPEAAATLSTDTVAISYELSNTSFEGVSGVAYRITNDSTDERITNWTAGPYNTTDKPFEMSITAGSLAEGSYSAEFRLIDSDGEPLEASTATDSVTFDIKTTPPTVALAIESAGDLELFGPHNPAVISATVTDRLDATTGLSISDPDGSVVANWSLSTATGSGEQTTLEWNATDASIPVDSGSYNVTLTADDGIGNTAETNETISVDTDTPTVDLAALTNVTSVEGDRQFINSTDSPAFDITATDGQQFAGPVDSLTIAIESRSTNHRHSLGATHDGGPTWLETFDASQLGVDGEYTITLTATDRAGNVNRTTLAERLEYATKDPELAGTIVDSDGSDADVVVRSDRPLGDDPTAVVTAPDNSTHSVDLTANGDHWAGRFGTDDDGVYELVVTATDRHGNTGSDTSSVRVETASSTDDELVVYNERTGTFIHIETDQLVENQFVVISESANSPAALGATQSPVGFLTSTLDDDLAGNMSNATIGIPTATYEPPAGLAAGDERLAISYYNETAEKWEDRETRLETVESGVFAPEIDGEYWLTTVESFSSYGVTATNSEPPAIIARSPAAGEQLEAGTDSTSLSIEYEDDLSTVNVSALEFRGDGELLTDDDNTDITADQLTHTAFDLKDDTSYTVELYLEDTAGNGQWYDYAFSVDTEVSDDGDGGDDGGEDTGGDNGDSGSNDDSGDDDGDGDDDGGDSIDEEDDRDSDDTDEEDDAGDDTDEEDNAGDDTDEDDSGSNSDESDAGGSDAADRDDSDGGGDGANAGDDQSVETDTGDDLETVDDETPGFGIGASIAGIVGLLLVRRLRS